MTNDISRRDFLEATAAIAAAWQLPGGAITNPPHAPAPKGTVVLFQGDSITDAGRNRESADPNAAGALGNGYPLLVASAVLAARPSGGLRFYNRGISGNKVPDLQQRWTADTIDLHPQVLSILIGVNDFWHKLDHGYNGTVQDYEQQYNALLDGTRQALPRVHLIVLEPFVLRCGAVDARWFPEFDQRRAAAARVAKRARATFVPLQTVFNQHTRTTPAEYWAADGVHPTPAGHAVIAEQWRRAAHL
ncbi:MAG TPA: GDSL-type esterase/lipase family protein [Gemmatimonadales bacterium]|nr:GDSL-type esterase/lipase family protein [Gemmatimonadales bacterium]